MRKDGKRRSGVVKERGSEGEEGTGEKERSEKRKRRKGRKGRYLGGNLVTVWGGVRSGGGVRSPNCKSISTNCKMLASMLLVIASSLMYHLRIHSIT